MISWDVSFVSHGAALDLAVMTTVAEYLNISHGTTSIECPRRNNWNAEKIDFHPKLGQPIPAAWLGLIYFLREQMCHENRDKLLTWYSMSWFYEHTVISLVCTFAKTLTSHFWFRFIDRSCLVQCGRCANSTVGIQRVKCFVSTRWMEEQFYIILVNLNKVCSKYRLCRFSTKYSNGCLQWADVSHTISPEQWPNSLGNFLSNHMH